MLIASKRIAGGAGLAPVLVRRAATLELDWDTRQKSRFDAVDSQGRQIGVFLPRGGAVRGGDVLVAEDGSLIAVKAKAEPLLAVTLGAHGRAARPAARRLPPRQPTRAARADADALQLEPDHVLAEMLRRWGWSSRRSRRRRARGRRVRRGRFGRTTTRARHGHGTA
jgi:urease accessory protein